MAAILRERPGDIRLLGAGKLATTLRARVMSLRRYVVWLSAAYGLSFPSEASHLVGYLQARAQEPSTRGGLKAAHQAMRFFEEITAIREQGRLTDSAVYVLAKKEILAAALPGGFPKQAPRFPTAVLAALEGVVSDQSVVQYFRIYSWWILVLCWGTLRFSDHRGIRPADVSLDSEGFVAKLTRSKTIGRDRAVSMRLVVICKGAFVQSSSWMVTGWELLKQAAAFDRDCLLPSPTDGFRGCRRKELKYVIGSAVQFRVLSSLKVDGKQLFEHKVAQHWTPHSGRNYLPSATGALSERVTEIFSEGGLPKPVTVILGWQGNGSRRCSLQLRPRFPTM